MFPFFEIALPSLCKGWVVSFPTCLEPLPILLVRYFPGSCSSSVFRSLYRLNKSLSACHAGREKSLSVRFSLILANTQRECQTPPDGCRAVGLHMHMQRDDVRRKHKTGYLAYLGDTSIPLSRRS
jgi:hypothetical protein